MNVKEFAKKYDLNILNEEVVEKEVSCCYVTDLLSYAIANLDENCIWVTIQEHMNIIAAASLKDCNAIIIAENDNIEESVIKKATEEEVLLINTKLKIFEVCEKIFKELENEKAMS